MLTAEAVIKAYHGQEAAKDKVKWAEQNREAHKQLMEAIKAWRQEQM